MRAFAVAISAGFVAVASAGTCSQFPVNQLPSDPWAEHNGITKPTKAAGCTVGKACPIEWYTNDVASTYQIELYSGCPLDCKFVTCIASDLENTGKYDGWTPAKDLKAGAGFGIKLVALKEKKFQWSSDFPIEAGATTPDDDDEDKPGKPGKPDDDDDDEDKPGKPPGGDDVIVGDDEYCEWVDDDETTTPDVPAVDEPVVDEPVVDEPVEDDTTSDVPAANVPAVDVPAADVPEDDTLLQSTGSAASFGASVGVVALVAGLVAAF